MKQKLIYALLRILALFANSVLPMLFWILLIFGFDVPYIAILTIICALIHELGHILAISYMSSDSEIPSGHLSGFRIRRQSTLGYRKEIIILAMGPLFNIAVFLLTLLFEGALSGYVRIFGILNLATAISNLLPVEGYDGYGILSEIFMSRGNYRMLKRLEAFSFLFSITVTFFSLYLIDKFGSGYWIFGIFFAIMLTKLIKYGKSDIF